MKKVFKKEFIVALTVLVSLCFLYWGIEYLKGADLFTPSNTYLVKFDSADGLVNNSPVLAKGFQVGQVRSISYNFNEDKVDVVVSLDQNMKIPHGSSIEIESSLLGTASLKINLGAEKTFYNHGEEVPCKVSKGITQEIGDALPTVKAIIPKVDSILTNLNTLLASPALQTSVNRFDAITENLEETSRQLKAMMASLPPVVKDVKGITSNLNSASENLTSVSNKINEMPIDQTFANADAAVKNVRVLTENLNKPNSSLGMLINDPQLYNNLNNTIAGLDSLIADVKKNPRKYINLKIF